MNMNKTYWLMVLSSAAFAAAAQQPDGGQDSHATPPQRSADQMQQMQMQQMETRMQAMRTLMERIQNTEDPEERQRLLDEHATSMQQGMMMMGEMMRGQGGGPMQGGQCAQNDTQCRMQGMQGQQRMMGHHMGMMQMMMEQMMGQMMQREAQPPTGDAPQTQDHAEHH